MSPKDYRLKRKKHRVLYGESRKCDLCYNEMWLPMDSEYDLSELMVVCGACHMLYSKCCTKVGIRMMNGALSSPGGFLFNKEEFGKIVRLMEEHGIIEKLVLDRLSEVKGEVHE